MLIKRDKVDLCNYLEDTSNLVGVPSAVYLPVTYAELYSVMDDCRRTKTPLTLAAGRTGTTGGCVTSQGVIVSVERLNRILSLDAATKTIKVEAGITLEAIEKEARRFNLSFRAAPTEDLACIGGAIATGASGVRGFGYGSIRKYIREIEVLLSTGESLTITRGQYKAQKREFDLQCDDKNIHVRLPSYELPRVKSQSGFYVKENMDLIDLFIGSEGVLGIVVSAQLQLQDIPFLVLDGILFFPDSASALDCVSDLQIAKETSEIAGLISLEFFDRNSLALLANEYAFIPKDASAVYFEQEIHEEKDMPRYLDQWAVFSRKHGAYIDKSIFADTPGERARVFEFRHKLPQMINEFLRQKKQVKVASDCAVPQDQFRAMYDFYVTIGRQSNIGYVNFGHIGESHLHFNFLPQDDAGQSVAREGLMDICRKAVELGGTVSAEHGIGKLKKPYLKLMYSEAHIREMAKLKKYFDPDCLLNLDNIFDKELLL